MRLYKLQVSLKGKFTKKRKMCHHLLTLLYFKISDIFVLWNTKGIFGKLCFSVWLFD